MSNLGETADQLESSFAIYCMKNGVLSAPCLSTVLCPQSTLLVGDAHANESITLHVRVFLPLNVLKSFENMAGITSVLFIKLD